MAGGADVILLPEIPYDIQKVADAIRTRVRGGKSFSIVAVAEGALSQDQAPLVWAAEERKAAAETKKKRKRAKEELAILLPPMPTIPSRCHVGWRR